MRLVIFIRASITLVLLASHSPLEDHELMVFLGRRTRVAAAEQFDPEKATLAREWGVAPATLRSSQWAAQPSAPF